MFDSPAPAVGTANSCTFAARAEPAASAASTTTQIVAASRANLARTIDDRAPRFCLMLTSWASLPGRRPAKQPDTAETVSAHATRAELITFNPKRARGH